MDLIPTRSKAKLPKGFTYPIGAEVLSAALMSVPQYEDFQLIFSWRDDFWASEYQEKLKSQGSIDILEVSYSARPKADPTAKYWSIHIASVPSGHNGNVKSLLQDGILDRLKEALLASGERQSYFRWKAKYDLNEESVAIESVVRPYWTSRQD